MKPSVLTAARQSHFAGRLWCLWSLGLGIALLNGGPGSAAAVSPDTEACRENLGVVFRALQQYRTEHRAWPDQLGDLVPSQLPSRGRLRCPTIKPGDTLEKAGNLALIGQYVYEFETRPLTNELVGDLGTTLRSWKQWQMGKVGSGIPLLRCPCHARYLNLSFGGDFYESGPDWEERFVPLIKPEDLRLEKLLQENVRREIIRIPARPSGVSSDLVDLTASYNGSLTGWLDPRPNESLAELASSPLRLTGVPFDARGVIQLGCQQYDLQHFPAAISNIAVGFRGQGLVFLHGAIHPEAHGTAIAGYTIHFEDGTTEVFSIVYGRDVIDWGLSVAKNGKLQPAWTSSVKGSNRKQRRLYATHWTNSHPQLKIRHIDFVSTMSESSPFVVAISGDESGPEPGEGPAGKP